MEQSPFNEEEAKDEGRICEPSGQGVPRRESGPDRIVWEDRPSYRSQAFRLAVASVLVFLGALGLGDPEGSSFWTTVGALGGLAWLNAFWRRHSCRYRITDRAAISERGVVSRRVCELRLSQVSRIEVEQGVLERLLGVGSVYLNMGDQSQVEIEFEGIREPDRVRELAADHAMRERS